MNQTTDETGELRLDARKVLIVDDDPEVRSAIDHALQAEGALTQYCGDGNSAVRICESDPPDLVVLDMMLPKRSGFLVLDRIKKLERAPVVIMVTANEGRRHQQYAETLGRGWLHPQAGSVGAVDHAGPRPAGCPRRCLSTGLGEVFNLSAVGIYWWRNPPGCDRM